MEYIPAYKGYIADVPEVWFRRCDSKVFHFDELTNATVTPEVEYNPVSAGWGLYPVAYLPSGGGMEIEITSGQFNSDLFAMANAEPFQQLAQYRSIRTERVKVDNQTMTGKLKKLYSVIDKDTVSIPALKRIEEGDPAEDEFLYYSNENSEGKMEAFIQLYIDPEIANLICYLDVARLDEMMFDIAEGETDVEVSYYEVRKEKSGLIEISNNKSAIGELVLRWPVYASGDDCSQSAIKGHLVLKVFRVRATQMPGFSTSYKNAATNTVTFSAMDPKNGNDIKYTYAFIEKNS